MKIGLQLCGFPGEPAGIATGLADVATAADESGFDSLWVMDHFFQIPPVGPAEEPMLSAYPALAYLAALTSRVRLGTLVTGVTYRHPGLLAKDVTTSTSSPGAGRSSGSERRGSSGSTRDSASRCLPSGSASSASRRPSGSRSRCGAGTTAPSRAPTTVSPRP